MDPSKKMGSAVIASVGGFGAFFRKVQQFTRNMKRNYNWLEIIQNVAMSITFVLSFFMALRMLHSINSIQQGRISKSSIKKLESKIKKAHISALKGQSIELTETEMQIAEEIIDPDSLEVTFDDIGGLEEAKSSLYELLILPVRRPELFPKKKLSATPKGILLYGPPGTGKTLLAKATAKECNVVFINLNWSSILSKWLGESEKLATAVFTLARKVQPCIIFIDEIDSFLRNRSSYDNEANSHIKAQFMSMWDGLNASDDLRVVVIGATNRPDDIDEAIKRRMPRRFLVDLPGLAQREEILRIILDDENLDANFSYKHLAELTDKYSGSDLKELCRAASYAPIRELVALERKSGNYPPASDDEDAAPEKSRPLRMDDFVTAMRSVRPSHESLKNSSFSGNSSSSGGSRHISMADFFGLMSK